MTVFQRFITKLAMQHLLACVTDTHCRIGLWRGRQLCAYLSVRLDAAADAQLQAWLDQYPDSVLFIVCDVMDERYQVARLPQVTGAARRQLLMRKCSTLPALMGRVAVHRLGRCHNTRIEEDYLLTGIAQESPLTAWMARLPLQQRRVRGVYLQTLLLPSLLASSLPQVAGPHDLCLQISSGRLRLSYLQHGTLLFSRQVAYRAEGDDDLSQLLAREVEQTRVYLLSQQWLQATETLQLLWLVAPADAQPARALADGMVMTTVALPSPSAGDHYALPVPVEVYAVMQALQKHHRDLPNLAAPALTARDQRDRLRQMLGMAAGGVWLLGLAWCWHLYQHVQQAAARLQQLHVRYEQSKAMLPADPITDARYQQLGNVMSFVRQLADTQRSPTQIWQLLQALIRPASAWRVSALQWEYAPAQVDDNRRDAADPPQADRWEVQVLMTLQANAAASPAQRQTDWQDLIADLRQHPMMTRVQVLPAQPQASSVASSSGQEMSATSRFGYTIRLYLQPDPAGIARS